VGKGKTRNRKIMKPKIIIEIDKGTLCGVYSTEEIDYMVIDHDCLREGGYLPQFFQEQDYLRTEKDLQKCLKEWEREYEQGEFYIDEEEC
jgi:hypothetical protein